MSLKVVIGTRVLWKFNNFGGTVYSPLFPTKLISTARTNYFDIESIVVLINLDVAGKKTSVNIGNWSTIGKISTMCTARREFYRGSDSDDTQIPLRLSFLPIIIQRTTIKNLTVYERPLSQRVRTNRNAWLASPWQVA